MTKLTFFLLCCFILSNSGLANDDHRDNHYNHHNENQYPETEDDRWGSHDNRSGDKYFDQGNVVEVETLAKTSFSWDGGALPFYPSTEPEITILRIKIPAGVQLPIHKHPVINAGVLLRGELTVMTEDQSEFLHLKAGDAIVELVDKWHFGINEGDKTAEIIVFYAGTPSTPITITK